MHEKAFRPPSYEYRKLGKARILTVQQLRGASGLWLHIDDLQHNHRLLSADEYESLTSWLDAAEPSSAGELASDVHTPKPTSTRRIRVQPQGMACTACPGVIPPCLRGSLVRPLSDGLAELEPLPDVGIPEQSIQRTSDEELARHLCQTSQWTARPLVMWNACSPWHWLRRPPKQRRPLW